MALIATMRGVVWEGTPFQMSVRPVAMPYLQAETDAIIKTSATAICGSDLHIYRGIYGSPEVPWTMGHGGMGYIQDIGNGVVHHSVGDLVVIPGGSDPSVLEMEGPELGVGFALGRTWGDAEGSGCQAEYVRVPYADLSLIPVPAEISSPPNTTSSNLTTDSNLTTPAARDLDYLFLSDIFPTGWAALDFARFEVGDTVAVFGAGPVGLLSAHSAMIRGASKVYVVDYLQSRLDLAASIGAVPINFVDTDPVEEILRYEPNGGVHRSVDCVGAEAFNNNLEIDQNIIISQMIAVTKASGGIGQVGVTSAFADSPGTPRGSTISPNITFPAASFFDKGLSFMSGGVDHKSYAPMLSNLIATGKARPSFIVDQEISIEEAPEYYGQFEQRMDTTIIIRF